MFDSQNNWVISTKSARSKQELLMTGLDVKTNHFELIECEPTSLRVTAKYVPFEMSAEDVAKLFSRFGNVTRVKRVQEKISGKYTFSTHTTIIMMQGVETPIPHRLKINVDSDYESEIEISHKGQPPFCKYCKESGHRKYECPNMICRNCGEIGHTAKYCNPDPYKDAYEENRAFANELSDFLKSNKQKDEDREIFGETEEEPLFVQVKNKEKKRKRQSSSTPGSAHPPYKVRDIDNLSNLSITTEIDEINEPENLEVETYSVVSDNNADQSLSGDQTEIVESEEIAIIEAQSEPNQDDTSVISGTVSIGDSACPPENDKDQEVNNSGIHKIESSKENQATEHNNEDNKSQSTPAGGLEGKSARRVSERKNKGALYKVLNTLKLN